MPTYLVYDENDDLVSVSYFYMDVPELEENHELCIVPDWCPETDLMLDWTTEN